MQVWYLTPFLLALLVWGVATRKDADEKEKWTWLALGSCIGAVLMFTLIFFSDRMTRPQNGADTETSRADANPRMSLEHDPTKEILSAMRLRRDQSVGVGSLQITLRDVAADTATVQVSPMAELDLFGIIVPPKARRFLMDVEVGDHFDFGFRGRIYRLGVLETQPPLWGLGPTEAGDVLPSYAVIRLIDRGPYTATTGGSPTVNGGGLTIVPAPPH